MSPPSRRDLFRSAAALVVLAACGPGDDSDTEPTDGDPDDPDLDDTGSGLPDHCPEEPGTGPEWVAISLEDHPQLERVGGAAQVRLAPGLVNVVHVEPDCYVAMGTRCTHEGCTVEVRTGPRFVCPCHGALYNWKGVPIAGPAPLPLPTWPAGRRDGAVWVKVG